MLLDLKVNVLWCATIKHKFNAVAHGKVFKSPSDLIVTVGEDRIIRVYKAPENDRVDQHLVLEPQRCLETKCGPATNVLLKDVTRLCPCDMIVSDTRGSVVLFCDGQILIRKCSISGKASRVSALEVQETALGHVCVVVGYDDGVVSCFNTFSQLWKIRLHDVTKETTQKSVSVTSILAASIVSSTSVGTAEDYLLVTDSQGYLHILQEENVLRSIHVGAVVTTMSAGCFLQADDSSSSKSLTQIALGCADGSIWISVDFNIDKSAPYAQVGHPITHLWRLRTKSNFVQFTATNTGNDNVDLLVCGGHFSCLKLLQHGKVVQSFSLPSWPVSICGLMDSEAEDFPNPPSCGHLLVGCQDSTLHCLSITG
ncbi:uncharacterized protein LOC143464940 [Clavelina lepadiformis]|uniref:uncharacterized protein LOC143464940 n=1 Tax=Clavelina lepadiformis TaxID=159417 RepID=UPI004041B8E0